MATETTRQLPEMADWQKIRYGDTREASLALAYYRDRGWPVDDRRRPPWSAVLVETETLLYAFMAGYREAQTTGGEHGD